MRDFPSSFNIVALTLIVSCGSAIADGAAEHWAFVAPVEHSLPSVNQTSWPQQPLDYFVLARLEKAGLQPAPTAEKETLLRRVWFDLVGLPPGPKDLRAYLEDDSEQALAKIVDSLLASPRYGERWARHWLDVARYGDSNGGDENHAYPHAFRYRNWVIDALNRDLPYDQFVHAQIAGDTVEIDDPRALAATGFLAIGTKILAEQDPLKKQADIVDEQIDTVGRAFLGMTLGCARCHDHKFDPIPETDYYALAGIFQSTAIGDQSLKLPNEVAAESQWKERMEVVNARLKDAEATLEKAIDRESSLEWEAEKFARGNIIVDDNNYGKGIGIIGDPGSQKNFVEYDVELKLATTYLIRLRYAAETARPGRILIDGTVLADPAITKATGGWMPEHQQWHFEGSAELSAGTHTLRIESEPMMSHIDKIRVEAASDGNAAKAALDLLASVTKERTEIEAERPKFTEVMAVVDGEVKNSRRNIRGNPHDLAEEVPRGFLTQVGATADARVRSDNSGRKELAQWMTSPAHPLTARVIVNRLWHWHFGRGLVTTTENFGTTGEPPTHPKLLDWLAVNFVKNGWSLKKLHRAIVLSSTYQMATQTIDPKGEQVNPNNTLWWKQDIRRLDAESFRDALLTVSGNLDTDAPTGSPPNVKSQDPSPDDLAKNRSVYENYRHRSVFLPVVRSHLYDLLTLLDFPNATTPVGARSQTTVPTQALLMLNNPFIVAKARETGELIRQRTKSQDSQIQLLYETLFSRTPTAEEVASSLNFLAQYATLKSEADAWAALCQTLLISNEFIHVW